MPTSFSSLESVVKSIQPLKHISKLVDDLTELLNESDCYDVEIRIGSNHNVKTFKAHSVILKARSSYFKAALSSNWSKKSKNGIILFEKENISPRVFEVILIYIYNGIINISNLDLDEVFELLEACDELCFNELIDDLQKFLIMKGKEWIRQNIVCIHKISSEHQSFNLIQDCCDELIDANPKEIILKADNDGNIAAIEKSLLRSILEKDDLVLDEIVIWDYVIKWGIGQVEENLEANIGEVENWNNDNIIDLKNILDDVIPLIRFYQIKYEDFHNKIKPYEKVFDKEVYEELLQYYITNRWQPRLLLPQKHPRTRKGKLLKLKMKYLISSWIDSKTDLYDKNNLPYKFELVFSGTNDGFSRTVFEDKCHHIEQTVFIMKIKKTGELVGGYNPVSWSIKEMPKHDDYWIEAEESFIFKIDQNQINNSILSRVEYSKYAIYHNGQKINQIIDDIRFREKYINFSDLQLLNSINQEPYCYYDNWHSYKNDLKLDNTDRFIHLLEEFEVYKLLKKKS